MTWGDNINVNISEDDNINWKNRYEYVRTSIDDFNYILSRSRVKHVGRVYVGKCPLPTHNEKTGSFTIYPREYIKKGKPQGYTSFYCFGCGEGGDVIRFKQLMEGLESKQNACKLLEREYDLRINDDDIRQLMLKEGLASVKNSQLRYFDFGNINMICSGICREYLNWVRIQFPIKILSEFEIVQKYYKYFDEQILDYTMGDAKELIYETEMIIGERRNQLMKGEL